ncbi:hypothetical protein F383_15106 [Gossypium arboreum]|uniref:Uncharacterized protein n=1 Tax=Gossypium arboreum TaxID=29729 RepID=A0A0B0PV24_GOSAR|nr:hypothetical protein F383_15106 [Gossypium arboreum]
MERSSRRQTVVLPVL